MVKLSIGEYIWPDDMSFSENFCNLQHLKIEIPAHQTKPICLKNMKLKTLDIKP